VRVQRCCPELQVIRQGFDANMSIRDKLVKVQEACKAFEKEGNDVCATKCKKWEERLLSRIDLWEKISACIDDDINILRQKIEKAGSRILKREDKIKNLKSQENDMQSLREMGLEGTPDLECIKPYIDSIIRKNEATLAKNKVRKEKLQELLHLKARITEAHRINK